MKVFRHMHTNRLPMHRFSNPALSIELNCLGNIKFEKLSYPVKYGLFSRLETQEYIFEFNLDHEIRHARSKNKDWIHPSEWLKRTMGNDWIYYSTGGYSGVYEAIGEYYLPNLSYQTNSLLGGRPFKTKPVQHIVNNWHHIIDRIPGSDLPEPFSQWVEKIKAKTPDDLDKKAKTLFDINGSRVSVMPPDARHVDYNIIPINISDGCLYKCRFCKIKNKKPFAVRTQKNISDQIHQIKSLYGKDLINYNAIFIGEHDALQAPDQCIIATARQAFETFDFQQAVMDGKYIFMFASVDSLLNARMDLFEALNALGALVFINVGLESFDQATLDRLGKPLTTKQIKMAFDRVQTINARFLNIEITCNFVMDDTLPESHYKTMMMLIRESVTRPQPKGGIYLSPLKFGSPSRQVLYDFYRLKTQSRFPTHLYIIQRL